MPKLIASEELPQRNVNQYGMTGLLYVSVIVCCARYVMDEFGSRIPHSSNPSCR